MPVLLVHLALLFLIAFLPAVILAVRLRNAERHRREPWRALGMSFLWGATIAAFLSVILEQGLDHLVRAGQSVPGVSPFTLIVIAPIVEEATKAAGLFRVRDPHPEPEDGYIYGGAVGLGFAATENVVYIATAFTLGGEQVAFATAIYRGIATVALHGAASSVAGYGVWQARFGTGRLAFPAALLAAILIHGAYNYMSTIEQAWAVLGAAAFAVAMYMRMMRRVRVLDETPELLQ